MNPRLPFAVCLLLAPLAALAKGTLVSGPMLGYQAYREVLIWLETKDAKSVELDYWIAGQPETLKKLSKSRPRTFPAGTQPMKFAVPLLTMGANYEYSITVDGEKVVRPYPLTFKTRPQWEWRTPPPDFKFIFGSCAYLNETIYDRPGTPYGKGNEIFSDGRQRRGLHGLGRRQLVPAGGRLFERKRDLVPLLPRPRQPGAAAALRDDAPLCDVG
jgi:alkaline phosphatase D